MARMSEFPREKATSAADLPHEFVSETGSPLLPCDLCQRAAGSEQHLQWEKQAAREQAALDETAASQFRETGS